MSGFFRALRSANPSVKEAPWNAVMDGVADDTAATLAALAYCEARGLALTIPAGTLNLATWATRDSTFVVLRGAGREVTTIKGPKVVGTDFVKMTAGVLDAEGIDFQKFDRVGYSEAAVDVVRFHACRGKWNRSYLYKQADRTGFPASAVTRVMLEGNEIDRSGGFMVHGAVTVATAAGNVLRNVKRDSTVWTADAPLYQTFGISFGDTDNNASSVAQALTNNVTVTGNTVAGMWNDTPPGTFNTTNAIQVSAINATIVGNTISGMDAADRANNEAIYCKAQNYAITNNGIRGSKTTSACIAIKGTLTASGPMQRNSIVAHNPISSTDGLCNSAIVLFAGGLCDIVGNPIDGMAVDSVKVFGDPYRVNVLNNPISNNGGVEAITFLCGSVAACRIEGNTLDGMLATAGNMRPIRVNAVPTQLSAITVTAGGAGYSATPTITIGGPGTATAQATVVGGVITAIQVNSSNAAFTPGVAPSVTITDSTGVGATATAVLSTGAINDLAIKRNTLRWSPRSTLTSACGIFVQADSAVAAASGNVTLKDNELVADAAANAATIQGVNLFSATAGWFRDAVLDGLHMTVPDITKCRPVNFNSQVDLIGQAAHYVDLTVNNVTVNGRRQRILSKFQAEDTRATAVVNLAGKPVGSTLLGYIPYNVLVTHALVFTSAAPTSGTSTATVGISVGGAALFNVMGGALVTAFSANAYKACIPDGTAANAKRAFTAAGVVPVYLEVGGEALTGGKLELVLRTEALA